MLITSLLPEHRFTAQYDLLLKCKQTACLAGHSQSAAYTFSSKNTKPLVSPHFRATRDLHTPPETRLGAHK